MRNPFARLATRDAARPSQRDRATALKASASRVIRRNAVEAAPAVPVATSLPAADTILAAIAETERLTQKRNLAALLPLPARDLGPLPAQTAAMEAQFAHIDGVLLKTASTTAAGCVALSCYALDFLASDGWALDEDDNNRPHVRVLDLIARSPMLFRKTEGRAFAPDFSGMSDNALIRTYEAFGHAFDLTGLTTWAISDETGGSRLLDAELDRLGFLQNDIAEELPPVALPARSAPRGVILIR